MGENASNPQNCDDQNMPTHFIKPDGDLNHSPSKPLDAPQPFLSGSPLTILHTSCFQIAFSLWVALPSNMRSTKESKVIGSKSNCLSDEF